MISPTNFMKRLGVGGKLVPFFKCVCVYFVAGKSLGTPSAWAVAAKCAPVISLLLFVLLQDGTTQQRGWYARRIATGLALSALGDALLIFPQHFVAGMCAFAFAHLSYLCAFGFKPTKPAVAVVAYASTAAYLTLIQPPSLLKYLVPIYSMLLATMTWRGVARGLVPKASRTQLAGAVGAILFLISDAVLGYGLFGAPIPNGHVWVMSTYYLAQLGISLSALEATTTHVRTE